MRESREAQLRVTGIFLGVFILFAGILAIPFMMAYAELEDQRQEWIECESAGNTIWEYDPLQCVWPNGRIVEEVKNIDIQSVFLYEIRGGHG